MVDSAWKEMMMSEEVTAAKGVEPVEPQGEQEPTTDWKAEARKWEARAKADRGAAEKLQQLEDAKKTEEQKAADRVAAAEKRAVELEAKVARAEVAASKQVPSDLFDGPASNSTEDLAAWADKLIEFQGKQEQAPRSSAIGRANQLASSNADEQALNVLGF